MVAAATLGLFASTAVRADDCVGTVTQVNGSAQIQRGGATLPAQQGTPVKVHDTVTTQPGASMTLGFADGSSIALSGNTSIEIEDSYVDERADAAQSGDTDQRRHSCDCPRQDDRATA